MANRTNLFEDLEKNLVSSEPQTLESYSSVESEQDFFVKKSQRLEKIDFKVDYSNFSNFVFFNSALDYFQISAEKIINEYPYDGSRLQIENFLQDLDGYENYLFSNWPKRIGHLRFNPFVSSSYIKVEDVGYEAGVSKSSFLSPGTGSFSIEGWYQTEGALTGSDSIRVIAQKLSTSNDGYSVYLSGSNLYFRVVSGSSTNEVSAPATGSDQTRYFCVYCDRSSTTGTLAIITGSSTEFPTVVSSASLGFYTQLNLASSSFFIGSGTLSGKTTRYFTGSLDDIRFWKKARTLSEVSSSFNTKIFAQPDLIALWRFNESGSLQNTNVDRIVLDYSGHGLNGKIENYYSAIRGSGSLFVDYPDPILFIESPEVLSMIVEQQNSGSEYDKNNLSKITDLVPDQYFQLEANTEVLKNFLYVLGRQYDEIKLAIDHLPNLLRVDYSDFDQTPDALLSTVAKFYGFDFIGNFVNAGAVQYILGKNVLTNLSSNEDLDVKLYEIKNEFWKRTLLNLMYIYKTKGTRESLQAFFRGYGINETFFKIKEYAYSNESFLSEQRIHGEKSSLALAFGSGSITGSLYTTLSNQSLASTGSYTIETRVRFPLTSSVGLVATVLSGSIWTRSSGSAAADSITRLSYHKDSLGSQTGSLILSGSSFYVPIYNANIFDNKWYNIAVIRDSLSGTFKVDVKSVDNGEIIKEYSASSGNIFNGNDVSGSYTTLTFGYSGSMKSEFYGQEFRVWSRPLSEIELNDHALNYQSYGVREISSNSDLKLHWRLQENVSASITEQMAVRIEDISGYGNHGNSRGWKTSLNPYKKFLNEYDFIASPDLGWTEQKIRIHDGSKLRERDRYIDKNVVSLEFNMVDALNEDIVQMMSSLEEYNKSLAVGANKYRESYEGLKNMKNAYFKRLQGRLNFRIFADFLEFFDRSFIEMVKKLVPCRTHFVGDEFVVESHMLERSKVQYNKLFFQDQYIDIIGTITCHNRFGRNADKTGFESPLYLSGNKINNQSRGMRITNNTVSTIGSNSLLNGSVRKNRGE